MKPQIFTLAAAMLLTACAAPQSSSSSSPAVSSLEQSSSQAVSSQESSVEATSSESSAPYTLDLKVAAPAGAPATALYRFIQNDNVEITGAAAGYISPTSGIDAVIAPTNAGVNAIKAGAPYRLAATVTFGNFFLVSTGNDEDGVLSDDDYIVAFQENNVPGKVIKYAYPEITVDYWTTGEGSEAMQKAAACAISGIDTAHENHKVDYVFLAEPAVTNVLSKNSKASVKENVQTKFATVSGGMPITQASIFLRDSLAKDKADAFLAQIGQSVASFVENPETLRPYVDGMTDEYFASKFAVGNANALINLTRNGNKMGLGFKMAYANKDSIENFLGLFNITDIDETVYYQ